MARRLKERFDVASGLQDLREIMTLSQPSMVREASGVATLTGMRPRPSLKTPMVHPVALGPSVEARETRETLIGVIAVAVGLIALGGIAALAVFGFADRPTPALQDTRAVAPEVGASGDPDPGRVEVRAFGVKLLANEEGTDEAPAQAAMPEKRERHEARAGEGSKKRSKARRAAKKRRRHRSDGSARSEPAASAAPVPAAKRSLTRVDVKRGLSGVRALAKRCGKDGGGVVVVELVIGPDGRVKRAAPVGQMKGSPTGACVAKAAKRARFAQFSGTPLTIKYPFIL